MRARHLSAIGLLALAAPAFASPAGVNAQAFYADAQQLMDKGVRAMFDKRTKPRMAQLRAAAELAKAENEAATARGKDPVVSIPLYGGFAVGTSSVPGSGWLAELNLTPARRAAAGIGADLVRRHQERFVAAAWDQLGAVAETNRLLGRAVLRREVADAERARFYVEERRRG